MSETMKGSVTRLADEYGSTRRRTQRVKDRNSNRRKAPEDERVVL